MYFIFILFFWQEGLTSLHLAARSNKLDAVRCLIGLGANPNALGTGTEEKRTQGSVECFVPPEHICLVM